MAQFIEDYGTRVSNFTTEVRGLWDHHVWQDGTAGISFKLHQRVGLGRSTGYGNRSLIVTRSWQGDAQS